MNRQPTISIVIPAHNAGQFLSATLESILAQTVQDWECIVVNDGSTDDTAEIAARHARSDARIRTLSQAKSGASAARNRGFAEMSASSSYVTFMDSDDVWLPDALEALRNEIEAHPDAPAVHGLAEFIDENGQPKDAGAFADFGRKRLGFDNSRIVEWPESRPTSFETLLWVNRVFPQGLLLTRKSFFEKAGLFDVSLRLVEDWDMLLRLSRHGDIRFLNRVILLYRRHSHNTSVENHQANREAARRMHYIAYFSEENAPHQRQLVKASWRAWQVFQAKETLYTMKSQLLHGKLLGTGAHLSKLYVQMHRYLRGHPTLRGI